MQAIREYIIGIGAAAMICGIVLSLSGKGSMQPMLKLICGLVLTFAVIEPGLSLIPDELEDFQFFYQQQAEEAAEYGEQTADKNVRAIIISQIEAYVLEKAEQMNLDIQVHAELSEDQPPLPESISISGQVSPYERKQLSRFLEKELGIREANQKWIS